MFQSSRLIPVVFSALAVNVANPELKKQEIFILSL
jgi:hypothetical protein